MFKFEEICELIRLVGSSGVANVEVEHAGSRVRIEGRTQVVTAQAAPTTSAASSPQPGGDAPTAHGSAAPEPGTAVPEEENLHSVSSPIVGTFYRAPNPDADPYVKVGDFVEQGQTLCIVEAMKLMNEIEAEVAGEVLKIHPENGQPVQYGDSLFTIRPA
jgi:acetyl-CoA carboxylase biotin carboxyl carrier protein